LIDLGAGPGLLALGFAPYVGRVVGVDPEPAMADEARRAPAAAEVGLVMIEGRAEDLDADIGRFDVVTIGRALHWMEREATLATFDRILAPRGAGSDGSRLHQRGDIPPSPVLRPLVAMTC
jgi:ubiquinone/menaquinone biosynthesis C-methylase UbiE